MHEGKDAEVGYSRDTSPQIVNWSEGVRGVIRCGDNDSLAQFVHCRCWNLCRAPYTEHNKLSAPGPDSSCDLQMRQRTFIFLTKCSTCTNKTREIAEKNDYLPPIIRYGAADIKYDA